MSHEYIVSIVLVVGSALKIFGVEIESEALEGLVAGLAALYIAYRRLQKGDINALGARI